MIGKPLNGPVAVEIEGGIAWPELMGACITCLDAPTIDPEFPAAVAALGTCPAFAVNGSIKRSDRCSKL